MLVGVTRGADSPRDDVGPMTSLQLGGYDPLDARLDDAAIAPSATGSRTSFRRAPGRMVRLVGSRGVVAARRHGARPSRHQPAVAGRAGAARSRDPGRARGAWRARRPERGRSQDEETGACWPAAVSSRPSPRSLVAAWLALAGAARVLTANAFPVWMVGGAIGLCAATSLAVPGGNRYRKRGRRTCGSSSSDVLLPIILGGLLLGAHSRWARRCRASRSSGRPRSLPCCSAVSGWLLLARAGVGHRAARVCLRDHAADWRGRGLPRRCRRC